MTTRDLAWRGGGIVLLVAACGFGLVNRASTTDFSATTADLLFGLLGFVLAVVGIVLLIQGKRIPAAWRAELRRHRHQTIARSAARRRPWAARGPGVL